MSCSVTQILPAGYPQSVEVRSCQTDAGPSSGGEAPCIGFSQRLFCLLAILSQLAWSARPVLKHTQVTVSVYNDARVPPAILSRAEERAAKIFASAYFQVSWVNFAEVRHLPNGLA